MTDSVEFIRPSAIVVFGATGDLASTKLFPALFSLYQGGRLPLGTTIFGMSRKKWNDGMFQNHVHSLIREKFPITDEGAIAEFSKCFQYLEGDFCQKSAYLRVKDALSFYDKKMGICSNKLFYLAVPPEHYGEIFDLLAETQALSACLGGGSWARLLVEKPFGKDLQTARALEEKLSSLFTEDQIYRIDHYLAKDAIEGILSFRFANSIIGDSWNSDRIESIHIKLFETKDVSQRGALYDDIGTLRDVGQNHILQILALLLIDRVDQKNNTDVRRARADALRGIRDVVPTKITRAQYKGYEVTEGVKENSETETYFKVEATLTEKPWKGLRIILEAGKAMRTSVNEAVIIFKTLDTCECGSKKTPHTHKNTIKIEFSPIMRTTITLLAKRPGFTNELVERDVVLSRESSPSEYSPEAYERLLYDALRGDQSRFVSGDEIESSWHFITPILTAFETLPLARYEKGTDPQ